MAPSVFVKAGVVALAALTSSAAAAAVVAPTEYKVADVFQGQTFFDQFNFNAVCTVGVVYLPMLKIDRMLTRPMDSSTSRRTMLPRARG